MRAGIGTRLVALVVLPLAALGTVAAAFVAHEQQSVEDARDALARIEDVETVAIALSALYAEATTSEVLLQARFPSQRIPDASFLTNSAIRSARLEGRKLLDGSLLNNPGLRRVIDTTALQEARALVDAPDATRASITPVVEQYDRIRSALEAEVDGQLRELARRAGAVDPSLELGRTIEAQRATTAVIRAVIELQRAGLQAWFGDDLLTAQRRLVLARGQFESAMAAARQVEVAKATQTIDERYRALGSATVLSYLDQLIESPTTPPAPLAAVGMIDQVVANAIDLNALMLDLAGDATDRTLAVRDDRLRRQQTLVLWSVAAAVAIVGTSLIVAQGIRRPLRGLGVAAGRLRRGDLDASTDHLGGPPEVRDAAAALAELRESLVLAEAQGRALAAAELDAEVLHRPSSGPLGDLVRATFATLSESIRDGERLRERLAHQASHDALTGLANRAAALGRIEELLALRSSSAAAEPVAAVLFIDLDQFKAANDRFGHAAGDHVLRVSAERMRSATSDSDVVARLGGDEFMVLARSARTDEEACALGRRIADLLARPIDYLHHELQVRACVGVALARPGDDARAVLRDADLAVYESKRIGSGVVTSYEATFARSLAQRDADVDALRRALDGDQDGAALEVVYRPVHNFAGDGRVRFEADPRWRREDGRSLGRDALVALAAAGDAISALDRWVLHRALDDLAGWRASAPGADVTVDVTVSGRSLRSALAGEVVAAIVADRGLPNGLLTVEVAEADLRNDQEAVAGLLALRETGVRTGIRNFGPGGLAVADLQRITVDVVKVDESLVRAAADRPDDRFPAAIVSLVHRLGSTVLASGVATERDRTAARHAGFHGVAGPYFGRALVSEDVAHLVVRTLVSDRPQRDTTASTT
jgi:diguanylate cyclase (GGDEF)-like protein